ncbi:retrotransposon protein, putative, ty1-copia subclass [Tanacetum coccineum]
MESSRSDLSRLRPDAVAIFLTPSLDRSRRRRFMHAMPSLHSVSTILQEIRCRSVILSVSSPNKPKSRVFPPNAIQSADEEPIVNTNTQPEVVTPVKPDDISLPIRRTSGRVSKPPQFYYGFHIEEDKISDSTLNGCPWTFSLTKMSEASRSWNLCRHEKVTQFGFSRSKDESCIYVKVSGSVVVFLVLYVDDILLIGNDIPADRSKRLIGLSQDTHLDKFLKRFKMENSKKGNLPLHHGIKISKDLCLKTDEELDKMSQVPYALAVELIMYAMTCTRPDFSFALSMVLSLWGAVTWKSSKQDTVADSTCEYEYIAACEASKKAIWMKNFIGDLGVIPIVQDFIEIFYDNNSAVALTKEPKDYENQSILKENTILFKAK